MARKTTARRTRSQHPGVKLVKRERQSGTVWLGRYRDPDRGDRWREESLTAKQLTSDAKRISWAIGKSKYLQRRRIELAAMTPTERRREREQTETPLGKWTADALATLATELRPRSLASYATAIEPFARWCARQGVPFVEAIDSGTLSAWRDRLLSKSAQEPLPGGKRGARRASTSKRSPTTTNRDLRHLKAMLNRARASGLLPLLHRDDISDALRAVRVDRPEPDPLTTAECRQLLRSALARDARSERPIAPYVLTVLLTGLRGGEALSLRWSDVDLDLPGDRAENGPVGALTLSASTTKGRYGRRVDFAHAPILRQLFAALRLRNPRDEYVFGGDAPLSRYVADGARREMLEAEDESERAPTFDWQRLRKTAACYLVNSPGIFGAAAIYRESQLLGHSPAVAERHYLRAVVGIPQSATTLNAAMSVSREAVRIVRTCSRASADTLRVPKSA